MERIRINPSELPVGTKIVFEDCTRNRALYDVTVGKEYEIVGVDEDGDTYFIDDAGEHDYAAGALGNGIATIIN